MKFIERHLRNFKQERRALRKLDSTIESLVQKSYFHTRSMTSQDSLIAPTPSDTPTIVSLTTYSKRIHDVYLVIESIGLQTLKACKIVLWLDEQEFNLDSIPLTLHKQIERGLEIRFCKNLKSYKKLIPSLKEFPDADILTIDDDFLYPHDLIEQLIRTKTSYPGHIIGTRAHTITFENGKIRPYKRWDYESSYAKNGVNTFLTTGAGTLFPAEINCQALCQEDSFMDLSPSSDDVWINLICIHNDIPRMKVHDDRSFSSRFLLLESNQDMALNNNNVHDNQNDKQIEAIVNKYNIVFS